MNHNMDTRLVACGKTSFAAGKGHSPVPLTAALTYVQQAHSPNDILSLGSFFSSLRSRLLSDWEAYGGITGTRSSLRYFLRKALGLLACAVEGRYLNITSAALTHSRTHAHTHSHTHAHAHTHTPYTVAPQSSTGTAQSPHSTGQPDCHTCGRGALQEPGGGGGEVGLGITQCSNSH